MVDIISPHIIDTETNCVCRKSETQCAQLELRCDAQSEDKDFEQVVVTCQRRGDGAGGIAMASPRRLLDTAQNGFDASTQGASNCKFERRVCRSWPFSFVLRCSLPSTTVLLHLRYPTTQPRLQRSIGPFQPTPLSVSWRKSLA